MPAVAASTRDVRLRHNMDIECTEHPLCITHKCLGLITSLSFESPDREPESRKDYQSGSK